ncbi:putative serine/threonine protein phosphatase [Candidatus Terasakiella magnetica]|nr:putative serine/threonine protein phosphatase [Candidatus Terasakiella magnetica]
MSGVRDNLSVLMRRMFGQGRPAGPAMAPPGTVLYAIGDIHGEAEALRRLLGHIAADARRYSGCDPVLIFLGDYVDRGPDSRGVIDCLSAPPLPGFACHALLGNHEQAMLGFLDDPVAGAPWLAFGGVETLASYGVRASFGSIDAARCRRLRDEALEVIPARHIAFLRTLKPMLVIGDYAFVHAGIRPGRALDKQSCGDLLTIRGPFLTSRRIHEKVIVHGHTIVPEPISLDNRIAIDTGAYASGILTAVALWQGQRRFIRSDQDATSRCVR